MKLSDVRQLARKDLLELVKRDLANPDGLAARSMLDNGLDSFEMQAYAIEIDRLTHWVEGQIK